MKNLLLIFLMFALTGCATPPAAPTDHFYRLSTPDSKDCGKPLDTDVLRLDMFRSTGLLRERNIIYINSPESIEFNSYYYHLWHESPAYLIRDHLLDYLRHCDAAKKVTAATDVPARLMVHGDVTELMQVRDDGPGYISIVLELQLRETGAAKPLLLNAYREQEPIASDDMQAIVAAFSRGLVRIYQRFLTEARQAEAI